MVVMGCAADSLSPTSCLRFTWQILDNAAPKAAQIQYQHNQQVAMHLLACLAVPPGPDCAVLYAHNAERGGRFFISADGLGHLTLRTCVQTEPTPHTYAQEP